MTQSHLADALGLSLVHTNKTLRKLKDRGLVEWRDRTFIASDIEGLQHAAKWRGLPKQPRRFL